MPSGSHSGGGGSHFGGGSSGGSHFGGSSSSGSSVNFGPRIFVFGGRRYIISGNGRNGFYSLTFVLAFIVFFLFSGILITNAGKQSLQTIEADNLRYKEMITYANQDNDYLIKGVITDQFKNEDCDKYYITYAFPISPVADENLYAQYNNDLRNNTLSTNWVLGYSYSVYTLEQVSSVEFQKGKLIDLAINDSKTSINSTTDSIPIDFLDIPLEQDGEYILAKGSVKTGTIFITICSILIVCCIIGQIVIIKNSKKLVENTSTSSTDSTPSSSAQSAQKLNKCEYCGATLPDGTVKCPNCGGSKF